MFTLFARQGGTDTESVAGPGVTLLWITARGPRVRGGETCLLRWARKDQDPDLTGGHTVR